MNKKIFIPILIIIVAIPVIVFSSESKSQDDSVPKIDFIYANIDDMQKIFIAEGISMSSPTTISDDTVSQYCAFFDNSNVQKSVPYCITTALMDSEGRALGNLNMGGNPISPTMALAIIETPSLDSKNTEIDFVFQTMIEILVCDCWNEKKPGGFESVSAWLDAAKQQYGDSSKSALKSKIGGLAQKQLTLEITSTGSSYLWTLIIAK